MLSLIFILVLGLAGWTSASFLSKGKHQEEIKEELKNILNTFYSFASSLKNLVHLLIKDSIKSAADGDLENVKDNVIEMVKGNMINPLKKDEENENNEEKAA